MFESIKLGFGIFLGKLLLEISLIVLPILIIILLFYGAAGFFAIKDKLKKSK